MIAPRTTADLLLYCVKRIECDLVGGRSVGTGYICGIEHQSGKAVPVLITNKHVIENAEKIRVCMHTAAKEDSPEPDGDLVFMELPAVMTTVIWHDDPEVDLCGILLGPFINIWKQRNPGREAFYRLLLADHIFRSLETLDVCEEVTMVGCPNAIWDQTNGFPLFRRGVTASHPMVDFQGRREFAVDIAVFSGSSGSPIFLMDSHRFGLLGTLWGGPRIAEGGLVEIEPVPTTSVAVELGVRMHLGYVIKASETKHLLDKAAAQFGKIDFNAMHVVEPLKKATESELRETFRRNALCFCGSKMKYKHCHGKLVASAD